MRLLGSPRQNRSQVSSPRRSWAGTDGDGWGETTLSESSSRRRKRPTWHGSSNHNNHHAEDSARDASNDTNPRDASTAEPADTTTAASTSLATTQDEPQHHQDEKSKHRCTPFAGPSHAIGRFFHAIEEFLFPKNRLLHETTHKKSNNKHKSLQLRPGAVMLHGCTSVQEHYDKIKWAVDTVKDLNGEEGLRAVGFQYECIPCDEHKIIQVSDNDDDDSDDEPPEFASLPSPATGNAEITSTIRSTETNFSENSLNNLMIPPNPSIPQECGTFCHWCSRRLYYKPDENQSPILINHDNRKQFIADGDMYEQIARLCQEYAQQVMCQEANLKWVVVDEARDRNEPLRVLVSSNHPMALGAKKHTPPPRPTLLICTGRGRVRAGIFSRKHLICSGLEVGTALPMIREAATRNLHVMVVDPNAHGEANGFVSFQKTLDCYANCVLQQQQQQSSAVPPLYMLSHSASGGHFCRYLLEQHATFLAHMGAVAFTDSTHNVQWSARDPALHKLHEYLQSDLCVYFRCANVRRNGTSSNDWHLHAAGSPAQTDQYWIHRFGKIKTLWAGTDEHSLTNWYAHTKIWEHFDDHLGERKGKSLAS